MNYLYRCLYSTSNAQANNAIKPELLCMELQSGKISEDDYLAQSFKLLDDIYVTSPSSENMPKTGAVSISDLNQVLEPGYSGLEHGFVRLDDGTWYIAAKIDLRFCNSEMVEWWFNHCDCSERFRWWHPKTHLEAEYDPPFYATQPVDRLPGHYIGHTQLWKISIGGVKHRMRIEYKEPHEFVDSTKFQPAGVTLCIIGKIFEDDAEWGEIAIGHVCHMVIEKSGRSSVVSRMWLGDIFSQNSTYVNSLGNSYLLRVYKWTHQYALNLWTNLVEEMSCLADFLPKFYRTERKRQSNTLLDLEMSLDVRNNAANQNKNEIEEDEKSADDYFLPAPSHVKRIGNTNQNNNSNNNMNSTKLSVGSSAGVDESKSNDSAASQGPRVTIFKRNSNANDTNGGTASKTNASGSSITHIKYNIGMNNVSSSTSGGPSGTSASKGGGEVVHDTITNVNDDDDDDDVDASRIDLHINGDDDEDDDYNDRQSSAVTHSNRQDDSMISASDNNGSDGNEEDNEEDDEDGPSPSPSPAGSNNAGALVPRVSQASTRRIARGVAI